MQVINRREIKYCISRLSYLKLAPILDKELDKDVHTGRDGYWIRSLYFDSEYDGDLQDVLAGNYDKAKIRLRIYTMETDTVKLEYKCKKGIDQIKFSINITRKQADKMVYGDYGFLLDIEHPIATEIYLRLSMKNYRPKVMVEYRRFAYLYEANDTRITYDEDVRAIYENYDLFMPQGAGIPVCPADIGVLEVKYNYFLCSFIRKALSVVDLLPVANSKYAISRLCI